MADESFLSQLKRVLVGAPIPSHLAHHQRFSRVTGLAVLSSDPLSSVAYATEEILRVLVIGGVGALGFVTPIGGVIAAMLVGVLIALVQALTQVQEITLTFVPKIIAILLVTAVSAPFIGAVIFSFAEQTYARIPNGF